MTKLPKKLQPFIHAENLTRGDCITLLEFCARAVSEMDAKKISEMTFGHATTLIEWYAEGFEGIEDSKELFNLPLTSKDFLKLSQFSAELAIKMEVANVSN